jgi:hypothetical protein
LRLNAKAQIVHGWKWDLWVFEIFYDLIQNKRLLHR